MPRPKGFTYDVRDWASPQGTILHEYARQYSVAAAYAALESDESGKVIAVDCWDGDDRVGVWALFFKGQRIYHIDEYH